jgi:hypothetical protein
MSPLKKPFFVQTVGCRWGNNPVDFATVAEAERCAAEFSKDCFEARVLDCSGGPVGVLVCKYIRSERR